MLNKSKTTGNRVIGQFAWTKKPYDLEKNLPVLMLLGTWCLLLTDSFWNEQPTFWVNQLWIAEMREESLCLSYYIPYCIKHGYVNYIFLVCRVVNTTSRVWHQSSEGKLLNQHALRILSKYQRLAMGDANIDRTFLSAKFMYFYTTSQQLIIHI